MIITILSLTLLIIFMVLSGFHFYWLFGGIWGLDQVIPTKGKDLTSLSIPKIATLVVALVLAIFGMLYFVKSGITNVEIPKSYDWIVNYGYWIIPSIFILRGIGDFNFVGIFKKIKDTKFAKADSKIFSPL